MTNQLLQGLGWMGLLQAVGSTLLFPVVLAIIGRSRPPARNRWAILRRGDRHIAVANDYSISTWLGFSFAVFFYWGIPIWWWLWGFKRMLTLLLVPIIAAIGIGLALVALGLDVEPMLLSISLMVVGRVAAAFYVRRNHNRLRRSAYEDRGWVSCSTPSRRPRRRTRFES